VAGYAAFLRGINVSGHRVGSNQLRSCFSELGFEDVATFRASGNVVFAAAGGSRAELTARIENGLEAALGYAVPTFLRTAPEVAAIAEHRPFPAKAVESSAGKLQVSFLLKPPSARTRERVLAMATDEDRLAIRGRELYWLPSGGILDSAIDLGQIDAAIGPTTRRTKNTIEGIAAKHFSG
jgi:uncharacterized protein (DUF1697 family)